MTCRRASRHLPAAGLALVVMVAGAACSSSGRAITARSDGSASTSTTAAPPTTASSGGLMTTVFNCGGGAYEPGTLIVVCGVGTTTVTNAHWDSWSATGARGTGTVNLASGGHTSSGPAALQLAQVVQTSNGPQFSQLTVTWTGASPDGHPSDQFQLAVASA